VFMHFKNLQGKGFPTWLTYKGCLLTVSWFMSLKDTQLKEAVLHCLHTHRFHSSENSFMCFEITA
jgi:hypothetical protein